MPPDLLHFAGLRMHLSTHSHTSLNYLWPCIYTHIFSIVVRQKVYTLEVLWHVYTQPVSMQTLMMGTRLFFTTCSTQKQT